MAQVGKSFGSEWAVFCAQCLFPDRYCGKGSQLVWVDSVLGEEKVWVSQLAHCFFFFIFSFQFYAFWRFFPVVGGGGGGGGG